MLKSEVFKVFCSKNAIKYYDGAGKSCNFTYGQLWEAITEVRKAINEHQLSHFFLGVALNHSPALIAITSGIHLSESAFFCFKITSLVKALESIPTNYCFIYKADADCILERSANQTKFKVLTELNLLDERIVLVQYESDSKIPKTIDSEVAYCVATSGSTGTPKLVRVPTQCILPNLLKLEKLLKLCNTDQILVSCPPTFDPFVVDVFLALRNAACIILTTNEIRLNAARLQNEVFEQNEITIMQITPSLLRQWTDDAIRNVLLGKDSSLRHLILGGEPFPGWLKIPADSPVKVYNIYGITEVSCWASVELVTGVECYGPSLGNPLDDSIVFQLRDVDNGDILDLERTAKPVRGHLHIGSKVRKCVVGEESPVEVFKRDIMCYRPTGDLVELKSDGKFYYVGRCNDMVKRLGIRVSLTLLERCADQCKEITKSCAIFEPERHRITLCFTSRNKVRNDNIRKFLETNLRPEEMPDDISHVEKLPICEHGKIDRKKCLEELQKANSTVKFPNKDLKELFISNVAQVLGIHLQFNVTSIPKRSKFDLRSSFLDAGGTSIQALQITTALQDSSETPLPSLIGMLLNKSAPLKDVLDYLEKAATSFPKLHATTEKSEHPKKQMTIKCHLNMNKCIDASPTSFYSVSQKRRIVAVGSHSHQLVVVDSETDHIITRLMLPDRIESAVSFIANRELGLVGCYDGLLYCFDLWTGEIRWSFDSGGMIKCRALVAESVVLFGSYSEDANLFALDLIGSLNWKTRLGTKGILSSPLSIGNGKAIVATLDGTYSCLNIATGSVIWKGKLESPVFANATFIQQYDAVLVAEVQGILHCFGGICGSELWKIQTAGNLFSSPLVVSGSIDRTVDILFGCHDKHLYCFNWTGKYCESPVIKWKVLLQSPIYGSPNIIMDCFVVACSTSGIVNLVCLLRGETVGVLKLGGEIFSSPLVTVFNEIYVGCRDNRLYKLAVIE
ncbi:beta-alanine-activating enzyme [Armigeres subalbatus]|uniref:beta-alanine-activating enzyme n=1 Tax=Armigeres subalbatus TaxID=124917 RepID=UPI002ED6BC46